MRFFKILIFFIFSIGILVFYSYWSSKISTEKIVGKSLDYVLIESVEITVEPFERKLSWLFHYTNPYTFDDGFWIYTTIFGSIISTNPIDLEVRLRKMEKLEIYPYQKIESGKPIGD